MPKRETKRRSVLAGIVRLSAWFPWWFGVLLALGTYAGFRHAAGQAAMRAQGIYDPAMLLPLQVAQGVATLGQYFVPALILIGALISLFRRLRRQRLFNSAAERGIERIRRMSWQEFELLVGEAYRRMGYSVTETGLGGADGGIDLVLRRGAEQTLVQCKHWQAQTVGVQPVRELYGIMAAIGAQGGVLVTSGEYTAPALAFAQDKPLELINGEALVALLRKGRRFAL